MVGKYSQRLGCNEANKMVTTNFFKIRNSAAGGNKKAVKSKHQGFKTLPTLTHLIMATGSHYTVQLSYQIVLRGVPEPIGTCRSLIIAGVAHVSSSRVEVGIALTEPGSALLIIDTSLNETQAGLISSGF